MMEDIDKRRRSNYNFYVTVQYLHSYESLRRKNDYDRKRKNVKAVDV